MGMMTLIKTFKMMEFLIKIDIGNLLSRKISKAKSINQIVLVFYNNVIYFGNKLPYQIKNSQSVKK